MQLATPTPTEGKKEEEKKRDWMIEYKQVELTVTSADIESSKTINDRHEAHKERKEKN